MAEALRTYEEWAQYRGPLKANQSVKRGETACFEQSTGKVVVATGASGLVPIGQFAESKDAPSGSDVPVTIALFRPVRVSWFRNSVSDPVAAADCGSNCFLEDANRVSTDDTGSIAGMVWAVDATRGVAVEFSLSLPGPKGDPGGT